MHRLVLRDQNRLLSYFLPKFTQDADLASANLRTPESVMERTAVLRTLADALSASPPGDLDDHVVDDLCALFGGDAPLVVEAILRRHPQCRKRKNILSENVRRCAEAAQKSEGSEAPFRMPLDALASRQCAPTEPRRDHPSLPMAFHSAATTLT